MSQKKVDQYKKEKANRKQIMKRQKIQRYAARAAGIIVCAALLGWAGYSGYNIWASSRPATVTEINTDAISEYLSGLES